MRWRPGAPVTNRAALLGLAVLLASALVASNAVAWRAAAVGDSLVLPLIAIAGAGLCILALPGLLALVLSRPPTK